MFIMINGILNPQLCKTMVFSVLLAYQGTVTASEVAPVTENHNWYYQIGGGELITAPANPNSTAITLGASAGWGGNFSCGNFSLSSSVGAFMNDIRNSADQALNQMVAAATGFVASLPALIIQRSNPGLYDLFQNGLLRAEEQFNLSIASCEDMEKDFLAGNNPFDKFVQLSKKNAWNAKKATGGNAINAKKSVDAAGGDKGLPGLGGTMYAGVNQPPLNVTEQTAQAGYNTLIGRSVTSITPAPANSGRIAEIWKTPAAFKQFAVDVMGSNEVKTCTGCQKARTNMGKGLLPQLYKERQSIAADLSTFVAAAGKPSFSDLDKVSASGIRITPTVIEALKKESSAEQQLFISRLSSDIATANVLEKAELLLQAMETGKREPNLASSDTVVEFNEASISDLQGYIKNILLSSQIRKTVSTDSVRMLMARYESRQNFASGTSAVDLKAKAFTDGKVDK